MIAEDDRSADKANIAAMDVNSLTMKYAFLSRKKENSARGTTIIAVIAAVRLTVKKIVTTAKMPQATPKNLCGELENSQ